MQWRKITSLLLILEQGLFKSLCCKHLPQREILFSLSVKVAWTMRIECQEGRDRGCTALILSVTTKVGTSQDRRARLP